MNLLAELQRRHVVRVAGLYLVGAWLVVQVAATLLPVFDAPSWVMRVLVGVLAIGLLAALVFAWVFELTPEGLRRDADVPPAQSIAPQTARRMDRLVIVLLTLALGYFALDRFVFAPARPIAVAPEPRAADADADAIGTESTGPKSIAVLPFSDLSVTGDQEAFADGVAEEILHALGRVQGLRVAGRSASFYYRGRNERLSTIGRELGVTYLLEGSVRRQGDRVRIGAQMVRGADGTQLWSETFDGEASDVFALQERIAQSIADKLQLSLPAARGPLVEAGTADSAAYALYLDAQAVFHRREAPRYGEAIEGLGRALALDPRYARAASRIAILYAFQADAAKAGEFAARAIALDARLAEPHVALGLVAEAQRRYLYARRHFDRALELAPDDAEARFRLGRMLLTLGYLREGTEWLDRALLVEPLHPNAIWRRALRSIDLGDLAAAERAFARTRELGLSWADEADATLAAARGDFAAARAAMVRRPTALEFTGCEPFDAGGVDAMAAGLFGGDDAERAVAVALLERCLALDPRPVSGNLVSHLLQLDQGERALAVFAVAPTTSDVQLLNQIWRPRYAALRATLAFTRFARDAGLAAYWDAAGPPDLCRKDPAGDYRCE